MENHSHESHGFRRKSRKRLTIALVLTAFYMVAEFFGGLYTGSLTLIADAGHMLTDVIALALTLLMMTLAARPANARKTFGYYRLEILAAFTNGITLSVIAVGIIYEAYQRWQKPLEINVLPMLLVAFGGLGINLLSAGLLHGDHEDDLNMQGAWLHIVGDALGSVAAILAAGAILVFGWTKADPVASLIVAAIIIFGAWRLVRESANILLEGTPKHINLAAVEETIRQTNGVTGVHDLHVWSLTSGMDALSAHVRHEENIRQVELWRELRGVLHEKFGISHFTFQLETPDFEDEDIHLCGNNTTCFSNETPKSSTETVEQLPLLIDFLPQIKPKESPFVQHHRVEQSPIESLPLEQNHSAEAIQTEFTEVNLENRTSTESVSNLESETSANQNARGEKEV